MAPQQTAAALQYQTRYRKNNISSRARSSTTRTDRSLRSQQRMYGTVSSISPPPYSNPMTNNASVWSAARKLSPNIPPFLCAGSSLSSPLTSLSPLKNAVSAGAPSDQGTGSLGPAQPVEGGERGVVEVQWGPREGLEVAMAAREEERRDRRTGWKVHGV